MTYIGLTWDHPRGFDALAEAAKRVNAGLPEPLIHWEKQPLEGFESAPIAELAAEHDLLVLDHPHIGEAVAEACLQPLDDLFAPEMIADWRRNSIGPALDSYRFDGRTWALPLDVACQVLARRADRLEVAPTDWAEVQAIAKEQPVALSLAGPHAILTLMSITAGGGADAGGDDFLPDEAFEEALSIMQKLYAARPRGSEMLNPIALLRTMAASDDILLIPLVFGYVTYARPGEAPHVVTFSNSIGEARGGCLGGTGIGFSKRCTPTKALLGHVASLMAPATQTRLFPDFGGQPSARLAWIEDGVNKAWGCFYANTLRSAERAFLRPRFDGYIAFQTAASACLREALERRQSPSTALKALRGLWREVRVRARGGLDDDRGQT